MTNEGQDYNPRSPSWVHLDSGRWWKIGVVVLVMLVAAGAVAYEISERQRSNRDLAQATYNNCQRQRLAYQSIRQLAQYANEGLRSISPGRAPNRETLRVIQGRQAIRKALAAEIPDCEAENPSVAGEQSGIVEP